MSLWFNRKTRWEVMIDRKTGEISTCRIAVVSNLGGRRYAVSSINGSTFHWVGMASGMLDAMRLSIKEWGEVRTAALSAQIDGRFPRMTIFFAAWVGFWLMTWAIFRIMRPNNALFAWYDGWVGFFVDARKRRAYLFPLPFFGFIVYY